MKILQSISDWSEVWAFLIPLAVFFIYRPITVSLRPVIIYLFIGFILNALATAIQLYTDDMPEFMQRNSLLYNLHSIARVILFSWYIGKINTGRLPMLAKVVQYIFFLFLVVNFSFFESIRELSKWLPAVEGLLLLFLCMYFFLRTIQDESGINWTGKPSFLICTGIALHEALTIFIFMFITSQWVAYKVNLEFSLIIAEVYKIVFVIFCLLLAIAIYRSKKEKRPMTAV